MFRRMLFMPITWKALPLACFMLVVSSVGHCHGQVKLKDKPAKTAKATASQAVAQSVESRSIQVGKAFPNFELKDSNGKLVSLKETLNKGPVVLVVYRSADW